MGATEKSTKTSRTAGVVRRTMQIMDAFATQQTWGVRELAGHLSVSKSGLHRSLKEMSSEGYFSETAGAYTVSPQMLRVSAGLMQTSRLWRLSYPNVAAAHDRTGETVLLIAYDSDRQRIIAVDAIQTRKAVQFHWGGLRNWLDLPLSASGKGILAFLPDEEISRYFSVRRTTPSGEEVTRQSIAEELAEIRRNGYAMSHGQRVPGTSGVCSPIRGKSGHIAGAIVIIWPNRGQEDPQQIAEACVAAARKSSLE